MKKILLAVVLCAMTSMSFALESVTLRFYIKKTKEVIEKVVPLTPQSDGAMRVKILLLLFFSYFFLYIIKVIEVAPNNPTSPKKILQIEHI